MKLFMMIALFLFAKAALASTVSCRAELNNEVNTIVGQAQWQDPFYMGAIEGDGMAFLVTTSLGNNDIMSLWVREKKLDGKAGMFSFVDLSSGRDQYSRYYVENGFSIGVVCRKVP